MYFKFTKDFDVIIYLYVNAVLIFSVFHNFFFTFFFKEQIS